MHEANLEGGANITTSGSLSLKQEFMALNEELKCTFRAVLFLIYVNLTYFNSRASNGISGFTPFDQEFTALSKDLE